MCHHSSPQATCREVKPEHLQGFVGLSKENQIQPGVSVGGGLLEFLVCGSGRRLVLQQGSAEPFLSLVAAVPVLDRQHSQSPGWGCWQECWEPALGKGDACEAALSI